MSLEDIKKRNERRKELTKDRKQRFDMLREVEYQRLVDSSSDDIDALLSKLEQAEKALQEIHAGALENQTDDEHICPDWILERTTPALEQIHKD